MAIDQILMDVLFTLSASLYIIHTIIQTELRRLWDWSLPSSQAKTNAAFSTIFHGFHASITRLPEFSSLPFILARTYKVTLYLLKYSLLWTTTFISTADTLTMVKLIFRVPVPFGRQ